MPHNFAHLLYEIRRKAGHSDFLTEEAITVIRQANLALDLNITVQVQARGEGHTAAEFLDTNSEHLNVSDDGALEVATSLVPNWTISGWFQRGGVGGIDNLTLFGKWDSGQTQFKVQWELSPARFRFFTWDGSGEQSIQSDSVSDLNRWYFVLVRFTRLGIVTTLSIQIDNATPVTGTGNFLIPVGTGDFEVGSEGGTTGFHIGLVNRVGFWDRELTTGEGTELYSDGAGIQARQMSAGLKAGLKAFWNMYEASGQRNDSIGTNHLSDNNTVTQDQTGPTYYIEDSDLRRNHCTNPSFEHDLANWVATNTADGKAAQFTLANSEYLSIVSNPSLQSGDVDLVIGGHFTLDTKAVDSTLISKWVTTGDKREYRLFFDQSEDRFRFEVSATGTSTVVNVDADTLGSPSVATKYFILAWHDKNTDTINIQVDDGTVDSVAHTTGMTALGGAFELGAEEAGTFPFDGNAVSVLVGKKILSAKEKTLLYNSGAGKPYQALGLIDDGSNIKDAFVAYWNLDEASGTRVDSHSSHDLADNNTVTQATGLDLYVANARDEAQSNYGQNSLKLEMVNSSASGEIISQAFTITGLSASEVWSISVSVRIAALTLSKFTLRLEFLDSSDVVQATHNVDSTTVSTDWAVVDNLNRTSPATTTKLRATVILQSTAALAYGSIHVDGLIIEEAATAPYFDGDSEKSFWEDEIHNSANIKDELGKAAIAGFFSPS